MQARTRSHTCTCRSFRPLRPRAVAGRATLRQVFGRCPRFCACRRTRIARRAVPCARLRDSRARANPRGVVQPVCLFACLFVCLCGPVKPEDRAHSVGHDERHCRPLPQAAAVKPLTVPERTNVPHGIPPGMVSIPRVLARVLQSHDRVEVRAKQKRTARERPVVPVTTNERHRFLLMPTQAARHVHCPSTYEPTVPTHSTRNGRRTAAHTGEWPRAHFAAQSSNVVHASMPASVVANSSECLRPHRCRATTASVHAAARSAAQ